MKRFVRLYFDKEILEFEINSKAQKYEACWYHLERAHILGQFYWKDHFFVHWLMFKLALNTLNGKEILGQIPRMLLAIPGSVFGKAPVGNIGSTRVGIFEPMSIPNDLKQILDSSEN